MAVGLWVMLGIVTVIVCHYFVLYGDVKSVNHC